MYAGLLNSLLELAHATSQNLGFAHQRGVSVSYGEETITETNLLELRRRHPGVIKLRTFGKRTEAKNGADWEWHIIGRARSFGMRVQAKRLQQNDVLKINHVVKSSGAEQIDLLIKEAKASNLLPVYCFYASERQRKTWKANAVAGGASPFEFGCLIASAHRVRKKMPKVLSDIERDCVPWHYLVERRRFHFAERAKIMAGSTTGFMTSAGFLQLLLPETDSDEGSGYVDFPTVDELNAPYAEMPEREGLTHAPGEHYDFEQSVKTFRERRISKLIEIDVRDLPLDRDRFDRLPDGV